MVSTEMMAERRGRAHPAPEQILPNPDVVRDLVRIRADRRRPVTTTPRQRVELALPGSDLLFDPVAAELYALEDELFVVDQLFDNERDRLEELMEAAIEGLFARWRREAVDACAAAIATFRLEHPYAPMEPMLGGRGHE